MEKEDIKKIIDLRNDIQLNVVDNYSFNRQQLESLQIKCKNKLDSLRVKRLDWFKQKDARISIIGYYLSAASSTKLGLLQSKLFVTSDNWMDIYLEEIIPEPVLYNHLAQMGYIRDLDTALRFSFYQRMFSNYEAFVKQTALNTPSQPAKDYKGFVTQYLRIRNDKDNFINILKWVRHSIHNNGIHSPTDTKDDNLSYNYKGNNIEFKKDYWVDVSWANVFDLADDLINLTIEILDDPKVESLPYVEDIVECRNKIFHAN